MDSRRRVNSTVRCLLFEMKVISIVAIVVSLLSCVSGTATPMQTRPNFTGTWKIDRALSDAPALKDLDDLTYVISYTAPQMHVVRVIKEKKQAERTSELVYYTDGRGENISFLFGHDKWKSKTTWVEGTLVSKFPTDSRNYKETWSVSVDGNTLTVVTEITGNSFNRDRVRFESYRKVFTRASST
jgi:hypothetical protein